MPAARPQIRRQERDDLSELLLTELRRGLALTGGTFNNDQSRRRATAEAARVRDEIRELLTQVPIDASQKARIEKGLNNLAERIAALALE